MALELIAAVVFGVGMAGLATLLRRLAPGVVPRFAIPAAAGLAMIGFTVWSEYAWFSRQTAALPETMAVAATASQPSAFRPWTYAVPFVNRFIAVDLGGALRHEATPEQVLVTLYTFERHAPTASAPVLVDCARHRRADIADGARFGADGGIEGAVWREVGEADPLVSAVCAG
ncbi:MAG: hypothetical protein AAFR16_07000 [Pseudomonadota bacterium]